MGKAMSASGLLTTARWALARLIDPKPRTPSITSEGTAARGLSWYRQILTGTYCNRGVDIMSAHDIGDELLYLHLLWQHYNQRLHALELKEATQGINADPAVTIEITQIIERMHNTEERYRILSELL
jgi:hypothetical protein